MSARIKPLTESSLHRGLGDLCQRDARLSQVVSDRGPPPFWARPPGWRTLVRIILEQQVSLASGCAVYRRLAATVKPLTASNLKSCRMARLRAAGLTRQKADYCRGLAAAVSDQTLRLSLLSHQDDVTARATLCAIRGIGPWTADVYLLMALRRPDIWPPGDIALIRAIRDLYGLDDPQEILDLTDSWRPWRAVAARLLWHEYLQRRGRTVEAS